MASDPTAMFGSASDTARHDAPPFVVFHTPPSTPAADTEPKRDRPSMRTTTHSTSSAGGIWLRFIAAPGDRVGPSDQPPNGVQCRCDAERGGGAAPRFARAFDRSLQSGLQRRFTTYEGCCDPSECAAQRSSLSATDSTPSRSGANCSRPDMLRL